MKTFRLFISGLFVITVSGRSTREVKNDPSETLIFPLPLFLNDTIASNPPDFNAATLIPGNIDDNLPKSSDSSPKCACDWRYFKHYETKGCLPVFQEGCDCPVKFNCPDIATSAEDDKVCKYQGNVYEDGDAMKTSNPCEICSCRSGILGASITCIPIECPHRLLEKGCYEVYEADKCCPVRVQCDFVCEFEGKTYHAGQRMYSEDNPCLSCLCDKDWTGINGSSCHIHECLLERNLKDIRKGCIPIYHEKTCCPIEFYCGNDDEDADKSISLKSSDETESTASCTFQDKIYGIGEVLDIKHPTNCVTCTCSTPPDFTCIHKSCPPPPNNDYVNCQSIYQEGECCAAYECIQQPE